MPNAIDGPIRDKSPCKDCPDRYAGCHDRCEKYKAWKGEIEHIKAKRSEHHRKNTWRRIKGTPFYVSK